MPSQTQIADLVQGTLDSMAKPKIIDMASQYQDYVVFEMMFRKANLRKMMNEGMDIRRDAMVDENGSARNVRLFQQDATNLVDVMQKISESMTHSDAHWIYDVRETFFNRGTAQIFNVFTAREQSTVLSLANKVETDFWDYPTTEGDDIQPLGVPGWVLKYPDATTTLGFNATNASGYTTGPGGLSAATHPRWANFCGQYTNVTDDDLGAKMRSTFRQIQFRSPIKLPGHAADAGSGASNFRIYTTGTVYDSLATMARDQNENLGREFGEVDGELLLNKVPIRWVPALDADTDAPVYFLNFYWLYPVVLKGNVMRRSQKLASNSHNVHEVHLDLSWQVICDNRRFQAVLSTNNAYTLKSA